MNFWIGHDERLPNGNLVIGAPLSRVFHDETQARQALAEIKRQHPDARLICAIDIEEPANPATRHEMAKERKS